MNPNIEKQKKGLLKLPLALANRNGYEGGMEARLAQNLGRVAGVWDEMVIGAWEDG